MQSIKRVCVIVLSALLLLALPLSLSVDGESEKKDNEKILTVGRSNHVVHLGRSNDTATFWEYPVLTAGQMRKDGKLTIANEIGGRAVIKIVGVEFPYDDSDSINYLNALHLLVKDDLGEVVFDDSYAHVADVNDEKNELELLTVELEKGQSKTYSITLSCDFGYEGVTNCGQVLKYKYSVAIGTPHWVIYAVAATITVVVVAAVIILLVVSYRKKNAFGSEPTFGATTINWNNLK